MTIQITETTATWTDGNVRIDVAYSHPETDEFGTRDVWTYTIQIDFWVHSGHDLRSPTTDELNPSAQLAALLTFLSSDAEKYQRLLGPAPEDEDDYLFPLRLAEWAYQNDELLTTASIELSVRSEECDPDLDEHDPPECEGHESLRGDFMGARWFCPNNECVR